MTETNGEQATCKDKTDVPTVGFSLDTSFFVIDSEHVADLAGVKRLYGYCLTDQGIVWNLSKLAGEPAGNGVYVALQERDGVVTVRQDHMGCFGLYVYRDGSYWALGNSFMAVVDHVRGRHPLTLNRAYADYLLFCGLCVCAYEETLAQEIACLDRRAVVRIDIATGGLDMELQDEEENTVDIGTDEGLALLDRWHDRWTTAIRDVSHNLSVHLSGGHDSRMSFALVATSGVELDKILVRSINDKLHDHEVDYRIASQIAETLGFFLNVNEAVSLEGTEVTVEEMLDIALNTTAFSHREQYWRGIRHDQPLYCVTGSGGENIRTYWGLEPTELIERFTHAYNGYSREVQERIDTSLKAVVNRAFERVGAINASLGRPTEGRELVASLYRETRTCYHFGRTLVSDALYNVIDLCPLMDKDLQRLTLSTKGCQDNNLLEAVIFDRYSPELLQIPFQKGDIDQATRDYAHALNLAHPYAGTDGQTCGAAQRKDGMKPGGHGTYVAPASRIDPIDTLRVAIEAPEVYEAFSSLYPLEVYQGMVTDAHLRRFHPESWACPMLVIAKLVEDGREERGGESWVDGPYAGAIVRLAERKNIDRAEGIARNRFVPNVNLYPYLAGRLDVRTRSSRALECRAYGYATRCFKPGWLNQEGSGYTYEAIQGPLCIELTCSDAAEVEVSVRGVDLKDERGRIRCWITCTYLSVDGTSVAQVPIDVWHDQPLRHRFTVEPGVLHRIVVDWEPASAYRTATPQATASELATMRAELVRTMQEIDDVRGSTSLRIGRMMTALPRALRDHLRS